MHFYKAKTFRKMSLPCKNAFFLVPRAGSAQSFDKCLNRNVCFPANHALGSRRCDLCIAHHSVLFCIFKTSGHQAGLAFSAVSEVEKDGRTVMQEEIGRT